MMKKIVGIFFIIIGSFLGGVFTEEKTDIFSAFFEENVQNIFERKSEEKNNSGENKEKEKSFFSWKDSFYPYLDFSERKKISEEISFKKADLIYSLLSKYYNQPEKISQEKLEEWIVRGILYSVEDSYVEFFNEEQGEDFSENMAGDFEGIGASLEKRKGALIIEEVLKGRPAAKVGLLPGDIILKVDGVAVEKETTWETVLRIRGKKGTLVKLEIFREGSGEGFENFLTFDVTRDTIHVESVEFSWKGKNSDIAVFEISQFGDEMISELKKNLDKLEEKKISGTKIKGIIIDLRYNGGGYLTGAVDLANFFLPEKTKIVRVEEKSGKGEDFFTEKNIFDTFFDIQTPLVVLVNGGSASASEIFAATIQENKRGRIVGEKTFGKGTVQQMFPLEENENEFVKITIAKWLTPSGKNITHEEPLIPAIEVEWNHSEMTDEQKENNYDPQMEKAVEILDFNS